MKNQSTQFRRVSVGVLGKGVEWLAKKSFEMPLTTIILNYLIFFFLNF